MFIGWLRRRCPICDSLRLTRSRRRGVLEWIIGVILLPYRCVERDHRFFKFRWLIAVSVDLSTEELTPYAQAMAALKTYHPATTNLVARSMPPTLLAPTEVTGSGGPGARSVSPANDDVVVTLGEHVTTTKPDGNRFDAEGRRGPGRRVPFAS